MGFHRVGLAPALSIAVGAALLVGCGRNGSPTEEAFAEPVARSGPKNVILLIGDGMGPQQLALLMDWAEAADKAPTDFERLVDAGHLGLVRTGAEGTALTDSASAATAIACGVEVPNGFIAMDSGGTALRTCVEDASVTGRMTGLVTSTRLTHATPASFAAHVPRRDMEKEIAEQMISTSFVDVMLGGGGRYIDVQAASNGYRTVTTADELAALEPEGGRVLGVFADSHIPYAIDRDEAGEETGPSLAEMTAKALEILSTDPDGFFLMVEGGRIDHAGHINDVGAVLGEMREFDEVIGIAEAYRRDNPDTLVIVTADHETGGLGISSANGRPILQQDFLKMAQQKASAEAIAAKVKPELRTGVSNDVFGVGRKLFYPPYSWFETSQALEVSAGYSVSFATQGHTTTPVVVVAAGPESEAFTGVMKNERIGQLLREWMAPEEDK